MELKEVIELRRSVHYFDKTKKINEKQLKKLFELVALSPSGFNLQPWEFVIVQDPVQKKKLKECAMGQQHVEDASSTIIALGNTNPKEYAAEIFDDWISKGYFGKEAKEMYLPVIENLSNNKEKAREWAIRSTSLACMTLMLAAKDIGLATCPMEGFDPDKVMKEFKIPEKFVPVMLIAIGYESKPPLPRLMRKPFNEIVHFDEYKR